MFQEMREMNQELRQMCRDMNFTLKEEDIIEQQLQGKFSSFCIWQTNRFPAYEARFGKL